MQKLKKFICAMLCFSMMLSCVQTVHAAEADETKEYDIYPIVREISYDDSEFVMDDQVNVLYETGIDDATKAYLEEVLTENGIISADVTKPVNGEWNILLGIDGSGESADAYEDTLTLKTADLYGQYDGYVLEAKDGQITIVGGDSDAVFRGVATLKMMLSSFEGNTLLGAQIEDYAGIEYRGFIEGFYGGWDYPTRESLMEFAKDVKMNMYVYASKTDAYHTNMWNVLYPDSEIEKIEELVKVGEENKCYYVWSVHLGSFFSGLDISTNAALYEQRYGQLVAKLTQLYDAGVRKFDILNDDFGSGSHADVVTVLNRLNEEFIEAKGCEPITYCPQGYNRAWSGSGAELTALKELDDSIILYWTGDDVNSPITQSTVDYVAEKTGQPVSFWLNYPVNEHAKSGIFLGNITHYARDGVTGLKAAVSNPSRFGYSNKVALFQLASLFWNNTNYSAHADEIWVDSFNYLEPEVTEEYLTIARNTANCPGSSRVGAGFLESEYIKENIEAVLGKLAAGESLKGTDAEILQAEFENILNDIEAFKEKCENAVLVEELTPWLNSLTDITIACDSILKSAIALEEEEVSTAWSEFAKASKTLESWDDYRACPNDASVTNSALAGSKRLQPFASKLVNYVEGALTPMLNPGYTGFTPALYAKLGGEVKNHDTNGALIFDDDATTYAQWNVVQQKDDYFGVDLGRVMKVTDISILQANSDTHHDYFHKAVLEYSEDGVTFTQIGEQYNDTVKIEVDELDIQARFVRLRLVETGTATKPDFWTHVREFTVNKKAPEGDRIYTNEEDYAKQPLTITGKEYSISDMSDVSLSADEYIGIKFENLSYVSSFVKEGTGMDSLNFEVSDNGTVWEEVTDLTQPQVIKYLRLINKGKAPVKFDIEKVGAVVEKAKADPAFLETNLTNGLKEGSWDNVFDGELSTYAWTNEAQAVGDSIIFDLGAVISLHDVSVVTGDGNPRFYNAEIQISTDKTNWETIASVVDDNSVFEVPYRYVNAELEGENARYLRIYITGNSGYYLKIHEIVINDSVASADGTDEIAATFGNGAENAIDGNLSTLFNGIASDGDYIEYKFTETTQINSISILQNPEEINSAVVEVKTDAGYEQIGTLTKSATTFDEQLDNYQNIYALRIKPADGTEISIYEIYLDAVIDTDDVGEYVDPIMKEPETPDPETRPDPSNIASGKTVTVSGTSDGDKDNVNDGDTSTKWDSNFIKGSSADENSWISIDLGSEKTSIFDSTTISYFNKIYPTVMEIQISNDGTNWTTVSELSSEHNGPTYPVITEDFESALTARYVRLFFDELNSAAAGNGVGVTEWEITGVSLSNVSVKSVQTFDDVKVDLNTSIDTLELPESVTVTLTHANAGDYIVQVPVSWNTDAYDPATVAIYTVEGTLDLPETVTNAGKAVINFIVGDVTITEENEVIRLSGTTRYETGYKVADALKEELGVDKFDAVVVATGKNFADALAGSYLAVQKNAPIILTNGKDDNVAQLHDYITANVVTGGKVYILGGEAAVPASVEAIDGYDVVRLAGKSRYETNLAILEEAGIEGTELIVATGKTFADSLSASAAKLPILLVKPGAALADEAKAIAANMSKFYIIGGEGAVSVDIAAKLAAYGEVVRVSGKTRYETSVAVANTFFADVEEAVVANGKNFPDGLCGGPLAAAMNAPLILTADGKTDAAVDYMAEKAVEAGFVLGGTGALADESVVDVFALESAEEIILR